MENNFKDFDTTPTLTLDPFQTAEEKQEPAVVEEKKEEVIAEENILSEEERQMAEKFAEQIDLTNSNMILQYGAGTQKKMADFSESASTKITRIVLVAYLIILCFMISLTGGICGVGCVIAAGVVFGYYYRMAMKNFGGVTGDLCGYFLQVCELVMALAAVVTDIAVKSGLIG